MEPTEAFERALREIYESLPQFFSQSICLERKAQFPSLLPPNEEKIEYELKENILALQKRCRDGLMFILEELKKEQDPLFHYSDFETKLTKSFRSLLTPIRFTQALLKVVAGSSWREALSIPRDELTWLYKGARNLFDNGFYAEAADAFSFLSWFDAAQPDFWIALGHSCFHTGSYKRAISAYGIASSMVPQEPWPHIHAAICYEAMGEVDQARDCLSEGLILEECREPPDAKLIENVEQKIRELERGSPSPIA